MARCRWALLLAWLTWPRGVWALRQIPDDVLRRYKELHADVYGSAKDASPRPLSVSRSDGPAPTRAPEGPAHHWPHARGHVGSYHLTAYTGPRNYTKDLRWSWHHPDGRYHTTVMGGPLIDADKNIYLSTEDGIRKFSPDGKVLWYYQGKSSMVGCPSLAGAALFGNTQSGYLYSLNISDGTELWVKRYSTSVGLDQAFVEVHDSVVVTGVDGANPGGNSRMIGVDAGSGILLWQYQLSVPAIDVMPVFPNDGTTLFQDQNGGVCRLGLFNGTKLWHYHANNAGPSLSRGGVSLGADGSVFSCANPGQAMEGDSGVLRKLRLRDGKVLWESPLPYACNTWPVVLPDSDAVVVPIGGSPNLPTSMAYVHDRKFVTQLHKDALLAGRRERSIMGYPEVRGALVAVSTQTGTILWRHEVTPWGGMGAAGDEEGIIDRHALKIRPICLPSHWSAPTVDAEGTIILGRLDGFLYAIHPFHGETQFNTGSGSPPQGAAFAPGMMAYADCDSLYVFNTPKVSAQTAQLEQRVNFFRTAGAAQAPADRNTELADVS